MMSFYKAAVVLSSMKWQYKSSLLIIKSFFLKKNFVSLNLELLNNYHI